MTKSIRTLQGDIEHVLNTGEGWTKEISEWVADDISKSLERQLGRIGSGFKRNLRLSSLGTPCERKLWYSVNSKSEPEPLPPYVRNKFIFGDITESYILGLAKAAGHTVVGLQDQLVADGIVGHRDCIIDGMLIDVKSAASNSFNKFKQNKLRDDDPFGYISQLSSYLHASQHDPLLTEKNKAGFLAFDKQFGHITVDIYDLTEDVKNKSKEIQEKKDLVKKSKPPSVPYEDAPQYKNNPEGNRKLVAPCSYCEFKKACWPNARKFLYSNGPVFLTKVVKEPSGGVFEEEF